MSRNPVQILRLYTERFDNLFMDIFIIVVLILLSAVFSASETAFSSVNKVRLKSYAEEGNKRAKLAIKITENFDRTLTTILIGNNIVNLAATTVATVYITSHLGAVYVPVSTAVMTVLIIIFGEIIPKNIASEFSEGFSMVICYPLYFLMMILTPIVWLLIKLKNLVIRLCGGKNDQPSMTEEELKYIIDEIEDEGVLDENESDLVKSALEFSDITISEILIPRVNISAVEIEQSPDEIKDAFITSHFSRLPVYEKTIDNIVGIIHEKNFFDMYLSGRRDIKEIIQKPLYIFELTPISELMQQMQRAKTHMAVVVDQYGGTQGIVTMEDIIEELVGEIYDETDEEDNSFAVIGENEYEVDAGYSIRDFLDRIELEPDAIETDCNSIGGLVMENLDHIPEPDEECVCGRFKFRVVSVDEQRIQRVRISVSPESDGDEEEQQEKDNEE